MSFSPLRLSIIWGGLFLAFGALKATADLPFNAFYKVTKCFNPGYEHFSPTLGKAALSSSLISNIRFYGNFEKGYEESLINGQKVENRSWIKDKSDDPLWRMVKILFPSNDGNLGYEIANPRNFSKNVNSPYIIALLLNFINDLRALPIEGVEERERILKTNIKEILDQDYQKSLHPDAQVQFRLDLETVKEDINDRLIALAQMLKEKTAMTYDTINPVFKYYDNPMSDLAMGITNDIYNISWEDDVNESFEQIMDDEKVDAVQKIEAIITLLQNKINTSHYIEKKASQIPPKTPEEIKAELKETIHKVKKGLEGILKKDLKPEINKVALLFKNNDDIRNTLISQIQSILISDKSSDEKVKVVSHLLEEALLSDVFIQEKMKADPLKNKEKYQAVTQSILQRMKQDMVNAVTLNKNRASLLFENPDKIIRESLFITSEQVDKKTKEVKSVKGISKLGNRMNSLLTRNGSNEEKIAAIVKEFKEDLEKEPSLNLRTMEYQEERKHANDGFHIDKINEKGGRVLSTISDLIQAIKESIASESSGQSLYPQYTAEQIILAFFCIKFNTQEDVKALLTYLNDLNPQMVDREKIKNIEPMKAEYIEDILNKKEAYDLDDIINLIHTNMWQRPAPYEQGLSLIGSTSAHPFDRKGDRIIKSISFSDCVEIALTHFMNLILYDYRSQKYDLSTILSFVEERLNQGAKNPYFPFFLDFYARFYERGTDKETRSGWNRVVGDLNAKIVGNNEDGEVRYDKGGDVQYELDIGFVNFLHVCQKIFGLEFVHGPFDGTVSKAQKLEWLRLSFQTLLQALTDKKIVEVDLNNVEEMGAMDLMGTITFIVYEKISEKEKRPLFSFEIQSFRSIHENLEHSLISNLKYLKPVADNKDIEEALKSHPNTLQSGTAEEALWLLSSRQEIKNLVKTPLYGLFNKDLRGDQNRKSFLAAITHLHDSPHSPYDAFFKSKAFLTSLQNIIGGIPYNNLVELEVYAIHRWTGKKEFQEALKEGLGQIAKSIPSNAFNKDALKSTIQTYIYNMK